MKKARFVLIMCFLSFGVVNAQLTNDYPPVELFPPDCGPPMGSCYVNP